MKRQQRRKNVGRSLLPLIALLMLGGWLLYQQLPAPSAKRELAQTWRTVQSAGEYRFRADVEHKTVPLALVTNVGRRGSTELLYLEGAVDRRADEMSLALWNGGGTVVDRASAMEVEVSPEGARARQGEQPWQPVGDFTSFFAPDGDFMTYLTVADAVEAEHSSAGTYFTFDIDGPAYATYMRDQIKAQLVEDKGLPISTKLDLPKQYTSMTGRGELWVGRDGLPLRQALHLQFPPSDEKGDVRTEAEIVVHFSDYGSLPLLAQGSNQARALLLQLSSIDVAGIVGHIAPPLFMLLTLAAMMGLMIQQRRSVILQKAINMGMIPILVFSPLEQVYEIQQANRVLGQYNSQQEALNQSDEMTTSLETLDPANLGSLAAEPGALALIRGDDGTDFDGDGLSDTQERFLGSNPVVDERTMPGGDIVFEQREGVRNAPLSSASDQDGDGVSGSADPCPSVSDCDADGLSDYEETLLGSSLEVVDTDNDGLDDKSEVEGFTFNNRLWSTDPTNPDSNRDGIPDGQEWHAGAWDTDGDGTPDMADFDNDNDGVPDRLDISPHKAGRDNAGTPVTFTDAAPAAIQGGRAANRHPCAGRVPASPHQPGASLVCVQRARLAQG